MSKSSEVWVREVRERGGLDGYLNLTIVRGISWSDFSLSLSGDSIQDKGKMEEWKKVKREKGKKVVRERKGEEMKKKKK